LNKLLQLSYIIISIDVESVSNWCINLRLPQKAGFMGHLFPSTWVLVHASQYKVLRYMEYNFIKTYLAACSLTK